MNESEEQAETKQERFNPNEVREGDFAVVETQGNKERIRVLFEHICHNRVFVPRLGDMIEYSSADESSMCRRQGTIVEVIKKGRDI